MGLLLVFATKGVKICVVSDDGASGVMTDLLIYFFTIQNPKRDVIICHSRLQPIICCSLSRAGREINTGKKSFLIWLGIVGK